MFNCKIVSSVLESVNYDFTISSHSPLSPFPGNAHFQHYFSSLSTPTVIFFYLTSQPHKPPFSLAPPGGNILPPHLTPFLHTVSQLLTSSSFHAHGAPLTSQQLVETGQYFVGSEKRGKRMQRPQHQPHHTIPAPPGQCWNYCISCGSRCCQQEKCISALHLLSSYIQSLPFLFIFKYTVRLRNI